MIILCWKTKARLSCQPGDGPWGAIGEAGAGGYQVSGCAWALNSDFFLLSKFFESAIDCPIARSAKMKIRARSRA